MKKQMAMLDALMGASRNKSSKEKTGDDFKDPQFCKFFLVGYCPDDSMYKTMKKEEVRDHFAFINRPHLPHQCEKMHSLPMKEILQQHPKRAKFEREYEGQLLKRLEEIEKDLDRFVAQEKRKCKPKEDILRISDIHANEVEDWRREHAQCLQDAKQRGDRGDVVGAQKAMEEAKCAQAFIDARLEKGTIRFPGEECCAICAGKYLVGIEPLAEEDKRGLSGYVWHEGHLKRKLHTGYQDVRNRLSELREKLKDAPPEDRDDDSRRDDGPTRSSRSRGDRRRDDSRDRAPPAKSSRGDSRSRGGNGGRRSRSRSRSKPKTKSYEIQYDRADSRDRNRGYGSGGDRRR